MLNIFQKVNLIESIQLFSAINVQSKKIYIIDYYAKKYLNRYVTEKEKGLSQIF